jgi:hypothetical protein
MLRYIGPLTLIVAALAIFAGEATASTPPAKCYEDSPCWHWPTMGNLERGVVLRTPRGEPKRRAILGPCGFAYYDHMGWIDWKRTPRLRGDRFARRHGCNPRLFA